MTAIRGRLLGGCGSAILLAVCAACDVDVPLRSLELPPLHTEASQEPASDTAPIQAALPVLTLSPLTEAEKGADEENGRRRIGAHRELNEPLPSEAGWSASEDGLRVWRVELRSPGAVALRLHFTDFHAGEGHVLVRGAESAFGPGVERRYDGDGPAGDGEFWSDLIEGDTAIVEYHVGPDEVQPRVVPFRIEQISHLWQSPLDAF